MTHPSEHELLARVRRGDRIALGQLLELHQKRLYNVCLRMVGHRDDAAEVTQDALLKIVQHIDTYRGDAELTTWMTRIVMNQAVSHLRKRRLRQTVSLDGASNNGRAGRFGDDQATALRARLADRREPGPDHRVQQDEELVRVHAALGRLDETFRAVLVLRDIQQMDYQQIAQVLDLPVGTVKSRLFRARLALREQLGSETEKQEIHQRNPEGTEKQARRSAEEP